MKRSDPPAQTTLRLPRALSVSVVFVGTLLANGCSSPQKVDPTATPIVLLTVDTLRPDHLGVYGYSRDTMPIATVLASDGVVFERAFTTAPKTAPAYASMFTGLYPYKHGLELLGQELARENVTLAEMLADNGYATAGFVSSTVMIDRLSGLGQGFDLWDDRMPDREANRVNYERHASETIDAAIAWLERAPGGSFLFVHLIDPHGPYTAPARYRSLYDDGGGPVVPSDRVASFQRLPGASRLGDYVDAYDAEIAYAGDELSRLVAELKRRGIYDRALIVLTADHGESLGEDGHYFRHGKTLHEVSTRVPLIVKPPRGRPNDAAARWRDPVSLVDLVPTLLDYAGVDRDAEMAFDGRSLREVLDGRAMPQGRVVFSQRASARNPQRAAHGRRATLASVGCEGRRSERTPGCTWTLIDAIDAEPAETMRLEDDTRASLRGELARYTSAALAFQRPFEVSWRYRPTDKAFVKDFVRSHNRRWTTLTARDAAALRSLGYVE